jgi:hypothetical protein
MIMGFILSAHVAEALAATLFFIGLLLVLSRLPLLFRQLFSP